MTLDNSLNLFMLQCLHLYGGDKHILLLPPLVCLVYLGQDGDLDSDTCAGEGGEVRVCFSPLIGHRARGKPGGKCASET